MATDRSVIQIIVEAVLRGTGIRDAQKDLRDLEAQEKRSTESAKRLDTATREQLKTYEKYQEQLSLTIDEEEKFNRAQEERARQLRLNSIVLRRHIEDMEDAQETTGEYADEYEGLRRQLAKTEGELREYESTLGRTTEAERRDREMLRLTTTEQEAFTDSVRESSDVQLTFFDRLSTGNRLLGERRKLLRDLSGQPIEGVEAFRRRTLEGVRTRGSGGRFGLGGAFPLALGGLASGGGDTSLGRSASQLSFFHDRAFQVNRDVDLLSRGLTQVRQHLGATIPLLNRFRIAQKGAFDPADLTHFDETMEIGFRRVARLLAVLSVLLPFITVGFGALLGSVVALIGGVTALAGAFGTLAGTLAALPGLLAATGGAMLAFNAVVGPGIKNITERFKEILQLQDASRKQSTENAVAVRDAAEALIDARRSSAEALADIERRITDQRRQNAESVADQERDLARLRVTNAEQEADAIRDLRRARRDAAEDARQAEKRYQELVKQNRLDERELAQELSARRAQLGALRLQGADPTTIGAAEAGVARVQQELIRTQTANRKEEQAARTTADRQARTNAERVADLERTLARTKRTNNQQEADAERRLSRTRRDNARQLLDLERQRQRLIQQGIKTERDAIQRLNEARRKSSVDMVDALKDLTPTERAIVQQLVRIREEWLRLTATVRERGLQLGQRSLTFFEQQLPLIASRINAIAGSVVGVGERAFSRFTAPDRWARLNRVLVDTAGNTSLIGDALIEIADAFLTIMDAARPLVRFLSTSFKDIGEDFNEAIAGAERSGGLDEFFAATQRVLNLTFGALKNLGGAFQDILRIAEPFGEVLLGDFLEWTQGIEDWTSSSTGARALESFFRDSLPVVEALANLVDELVQALFRAGREIIRPDQTTGISMLQEIIEDLTAALPRFERFLIESFHVNGPIVIEFLRQFGHLMGVLVGPGGAIVQFLGLMSAVLRFINSMPDGLEKLVFTYLVFHKTIIALSLALGKLGVALRGVLIGGGGIGVSRNVIFGLSIAALLAFPDLIDAITFALDRLAESVRFLLAPLDRLLDAFGLGQNAASTFVNAVGAIGLALLVLKRGALAAAIRDIVLFFRTLRSGQAIGVFARLLEAASAVFQVWVQRVRTARTEQQKFIATNLAASFSGIVSAVGAAIQALVAYVRQVRVAQRANRDLAISNAAVGFSSLLSGGAGLATLLGSLRGLVALAGRALIVIRPLIAALGPFGLAAAAALAGAAFLDSTVGFDRFVDWIKPGGRLDNAIRGFANRVRNALSGEKFGLFDPSVLEKDAKELGRSTDRVAKSLKEMGITFNEAMKGVFDEIDRGLKQMNRLAAVFQERIDAVFSSFEKVRSTFGAFIRARAEAEEVPARRELARIDRQEVLRDRAQRRREADDELREVKRQAREREQTLAVSQARLRRLQARIGTGRAAVSGEIRPGGRVVRTPEQQRALAAQVAAAQAQERIVRQRRRELNEVEAQVREVAKRRAETLRVVQLEERREVLERQAKTQELQREKEIQASEKRVDDAMTAYIKAVDSGKIPVKQAWARLMKALANEGIDPKLTAAWAAGHRLGEDFNTGFAEALFDLRRNLKKLLDGIITKQNLKAPVVIVTDAPTIRKVILGERQHNLPKLGGGKELAAGGSVPGQMGAEVPILAHAGEWVLNRSQQLRMAMLAGADRSVLERALFHRMSFRPQFRFAMGGVVPAATTTDGGVQFLTPINIQTASPTVDIEYVARAFESRIAAAVE